ncbi:type II toxin-antitoxin system VapC family toxin [Planctomycetota bacterium]
MYLIDTDIIVYSLKGHKTVSRNFAQHATAPKAISVVTYGELRYGAAKSNQKAHNLGKVKRIAELFPVVTLSTGIMDIYAELKAELEAGGMPLDDFDLLIGSTALYLNYTLVTNNKKHFSRIVGLSTANWTTKAR